MASSSFRSLASRRSSEAANADEPEDVSAIGLIAVSAVVEVFIAAAAAAVVVVVVVVSIFRTVVVFVVVVVVVGVCSSGSSNW